MKTNVCVHDGEMFRRLRDDRATLRYRVAEMAFDRQVAFQTEHGIHQGWIDRFAALAPDDLARDEYLAMADAILALFDEGGT